MDDEIRCYIPYAVGNKAKGRILKRVWQDNEGRQIFQKTNISYPWYAYAYVRVRW